jgi:hypothetical protein
MKQSSIEFTVGLLEKLIPGGNDLVVGAVLLQAKEMHKDEIKKSYQKGYQDKESISYPKPDDYYYEIFGTKE